MDKEYVKLLMDDIIYACACADEDNLRHIANHHASLIKKIIREEQHDKNND